MSLNNTFCVGCNKKGNCGFNCRHCSTSHRHFCKKCHCFGKHRSSNCNGQKGKCSLNCGWCSPNSDHICRNCGALNHHKTTNCPVSIVTTCSACTSSYNRNTTKQHTYASSASASSAFASSAFASSASASASASGSNIKTGNSIVFEVYNFNGIKYIAVHGDKVPRKDKNGKYRNNFIMSAGGSIETGDNALTTAIKESLEEHGCIANDQPTYIGSDGSSHFFVRNVTPSMYDWKKIALYPTSWEVITDPSYVNGIYGDNNCIQAGDNDKSAIWFVKLDTLLESRNTEHVFPEFLRALNKWKNFF